MQREAQQRAEVKDRGQTGEEDAEELPEQQDAPKEQGEPAHAVVPRHRCCAFIESESDDADEEKEEQAGDNEANELELGVFLPELIALDAPAQAYEESHLLPNGQRGDSVNHESSSREGRAAGSPPTRDRKICSSVVVEPSGAAMPARSSSSEPCATSRPR